MDTNLDKYRPNSHKSKELAKQPEKKIEKVVTGSVRQKKKSGLVKFKDAFISEDANNISSYLKQELVIPSIKKLVFDILVDGASILLFGEKGRLAKRGNASKISYGSFYDSPRDTRSLSKPRTAVSYDEYVIESRGDAEEVLSRMDELIDNYKQVSVADLCELIGITCDHTLNKYGWTDIHTAYAARVRDGYILKLPKPKPLDSN